MENVGAPHASVVRPAYDILRHNGVEVGKRDYLAHALSFVHERG